MTTELAKRNSRREGKPKLSLLPRAPLEYIALVFMRGTEKYGMHNWRRGLPWTETADSLLRHLYAFLDGEDRDEDTGLLHVGQVAWNALVLLFMVLTRSDLDDRYRPPVERVEPQPQPVAPPAPTPAVEALPSAATVEVTHHGQPAWIPVKK